MTALSPLVFFVLSYFRAFVIKVEALMTEPGPLVFFVLSYFCAFVIKIEADRNEAVRSPRIDGTGRT